MRPNFFFIKQKESGWEKGVYLNTLLEIYHSCKTHLDHHHHADKRKSPGLKLADIKLPIKTFTQDENDEKFDLKLIKEIKIAILQAFEYGKKPKHYTPYEILSIAEYSLWFIRSEFRDQAKITLGGLFRHRTSAYVRYLVAKEGPFFDFPAFKKAFRELVLTTKNITELRKILRQYYKASLEIVNLWNNKIVVRELTPPTKEQESKVSDLINVEFNGEELSHSWWHHTEEFELTRYPRPYLNQQFASYAASIANLLSSELLGGKEVEIRLTQKDFIADFIDGIHTLFLEDTNEIFIKNIKARVAGFRKEKYFRDWFTKWFKARRYGAHKEPLKGLGHIDLAIVHSDLGNKIIEFKGWWNDSKDQIIHQVHNYLTQFEGEGYIVMINHTRKPILSDYKKIIMSRRSKYISKSWRVIKHKPGAFEYFQSKHQLGPDKKIIHHFILSIY